MAITGTAAVPTPKGYLTRAELAERLGIQPTTIEKAKNLNSRLWQQIKKLLDVKNISRREFYSIPKKSDINEIKKFSGQQARILPRETYKGEKNTITKIRELLNKSDKKYNIKELDKIITGNTPRTSEDATNTVRTAFSRLRQDPVYRDKLATIDPKQVGRNVAEFYTQKNKEGILSVREILVADPDADLTQITKDLFGKEFENASPIKKEQLMRKSSRYVQNFLGAVSDSASAKPLIKEFKPIKPDILGDILENIESNIGEFGYGAGERRRMQFNIADAARGLPENTTIYERLKLGRLDKIGKALDEVVGVASTFREAPGYIEASQIIPKRINVEKGKIIDSAFSRAFNKALKGDYSAVEEYNKLANDFARRNPGVDVARIKTGKNLKPEKEIAFFEDYSEAAKKNIKELAKDKNIVIQTKSKPLGLMIEELGKTSKLRQASLALPAVLGAATLGALSTGEAVAQETKNLSNLEFGDPETWDMKVPQFIEEAPILSATAAATTPLLTKPGRKIYGKAASQILKMLPTPITAAGLTYGLAPEEGLDFEDPLTRLSFEAEAAFAKDLVRGSQAVARQVPASMPLARRATQGILNLGMPARFAIGAARIAQPLGLLSLAGEAGYQFYQALQDEKARIAAMSPEERQMFEEEQTAAAYMGEAGNYAKGGRVQMETGGDPKDKKKTPFDKPTLPIDPNIPEDPGRRTFMEGMGLGGLGIAGLLTGAVKFAPEIKKAVTGVTTQITEVPNIIKELYATIKNLGKITDYGKKGTIKTELGNYTLIEEPGGYSITKMTDSDFRYQQEYFGVRTDPEFGVVEYEELTALPDMDGKLKDVDFGVELNTYREIGEDLAKIRNDDSLIKIADEDTIKQIEKEEAFKESLGKKGRGEND